MNRCITIYTDASVHQESQTGGWAAWIKNGPGETALFSGAFKTPVKCTTDAELRAITNGMTAALKTFPVEQCTFVIVTDSQVAIDTITRYKNMKILRHPAGRKSKVKKHQEHFFTISRLIWDMLPDGCDLRINKVKAHSNKDGKRSYVNGLVDKAARAAMRKKRAA